MFDHQQVFWLPRRRRGGVDGGWLSRLVDRLNETSRGDLGAVPCDEWTLQAVKAQLARPTFCRSDAGLLH